MSVLHQNSGGIEDFPWLSRFPNTSLVLVEHGYNVKILPDQNRNVLWASQASQALPSTPFVVELTGPGYWTGPLFQLVQQPPRPLTQHLRKSPSPPRRPLAPSPSHPCTWPVPHVNWLVVISHLVDEVEDEDLHCKSHISPTFQIWDVHFYRFYRQRQRIRQDHNTINQITRINV